MDVLLIAADRAVRCLVEDVLAERGHRVTPACAGEAATDALAQRSFGLVVLDSALPGPMHGRELCGRLRAAAGQAAHVLVLANGDAPGDTAALLVAGADDCLPKPFDAAALALRVAVAERAAAAHAARAEVEAERARLDAEVRRAGEQLRALLGATVDVHHAPTEERVIELLGSAVVGVGLNAHIALLVPDGAPGELGLEIRYAALTDRLQPTVERLLGRTIAGIRLDGARVAPYPVVLAENRVVPVDDAAAWLRRALPWLDDRAFRMIARLRGVGQGACAPITDGQSVLGVLSVWGPALTDADLPTLGLLGYQAGTALVSLRMRRSAAERAQLDGAVKTARLVAHELGNQLAIVLGYGEHLAAELTGEPAEHAERVVAGAEAAVGIIAQLQKIIRFEVTDRGGGPMLDLAAATDPPTD